ncbi:Hypothetical predicted protein, partial [Paramuricea clavata]
AGVSSLDCYIQNVSMVKTTPSKKRYFNCTLQAKDDPVKAVCYSPDKHSELQTVAKTRSPIKLQNFKKTDSSKDIVITKFTKITPLSKADVGFSFEENMTVKSADAVAQVVSVSGVKKITLPQSNDTTKLSKQELVIRDTTASIRVVLWGKYVNAVQPKVTYLFKHLRVKGTKFEKYLNTPKTDPFILEECEEFQQPLVEVDDEIITSSTINATILGIQDATSINACVSCHRPVIQKGNSSPLGVCQSCHLTQPLSKCSVQWTLKVRVLTTALPSNKLLLTMSHDTVEDLMLFINPILNLATISEDELVISILEAEKVIQFTYDNFNKVTAIELV